MADYHDDSLNCDKWEEKFPTDDWEGECRGNTPTYPGIKKAKETLDVSII